MANKKQWLRNYDNLYSLAFGFATNSEATTSVPDETIPWFKQTNGNYFTPWQNGSLANAIHAGCLLVPKIAWYNTTKMDRPSSTYNAVGSLEGGIVIGTGNTEPSYDDYCLNAPITSNVSLGTVSMINSYDADTHTYTKTFKMPILYSGSTPVTVNEFGILVPTCANQSYSRGREIMIYREVFDEGITLQQNDTLEITFSQSIVQPNYRPYPSAE